MKQAIHFPRKETIDNQLFWERDSTLHMLRLGEGRVDGRKYLQYSESSLQSGSADRYPHVTS